MLNLKFCDDIAYNGSNNTARMDLYADTASDLTGVTTFDGIVLLGGSSALDISTGDTYIMQSGGTWILQPSSSAFSNVYNKTEIDDIVSDINADIADAENDISALQNGLIRMINDSGKNCLNPTATDRTHNGVSFTVNQDGTITANGTATANAYIVIATLPPDGGLFDGNYRLSGCPVGGSNSTYALYAAVGGYSRYDYGNSISLTPTGQSSNVSIVAIVYSGTTVTNLTFKPMICNKDYWSISQEYEPYCPTLAELYALVRSYHP
ncbi:MAG: hypothetical protein J6P66_00655 [Bacteroidaceae bacterium]|nr:hypothetical protein [Bacteroidaceae bacterium]